MNFFEPPAPRQEQPPEVVPPWLGPPNNILGTTVPLDVVLATSAKAVVTLGPAVAYPQGFELGYLVLPRDPKVGEHLTEMHRYQRRPANDEAGLPDELFRFGLEFADGARVTTLEEHRAFDSRAGELQGPVLVPRGGGGSFDRWHGSYWVWPLPPAGPVAFVCEWPVAEIPLTRVELDAARIREAAGRARVLWEADTASVSSSGHGSFMQIVAFADDKTPPADKS